MQEKKKENTSFSERITEIIEIERITANEFAKQLGYARSQTVYDVINGKSKPSADFFQRFINTGFSDKYSMEWLIESVACWVSKSIRQPSYDSAKNRLLSLA